MDAKVRRVTDAVLDEAAGGGHDCGGVGALVGIDPDDGIDPVCEHGHGRPPVTVWWPWSCAIVEQQPGSASAMPSQRAQGRPVQSPPASVADLVAPAAELTVAIKVEREEERERELQEIQRIRFQARIDFIREFMTEEQLTQLQRSRPAGITARTGN